MKQFSAVIILFCFLTAFGAALELPPNARLGLTKAHIGQSGGFFLDESVNRQEFNSFIRSHWRDVIRRVDELPPSEGGFENVLTARNATIANFCAACEILPPEEYVDFLAEWVTQAEKGQIPSYAMFICICGVDQKEYFLATNWQDRRVQSIMERVKRILPPTEKNLIDYLNDAAEGKHADSWWRNGNEAGPPPETLTGIRATIPFESTKRELTIAALVIGTVVFATFIPNLLTRYYFRKNRI